MRNIDVHVPAMELFCIWENGFTLDECDRIKEIGELSEFQNGTIGDNEENLDIRVTDIVWIQPEEDYKWIFERMNVILSKVNFDKFQMDLTVFDGFQYSRYPIGGHYNWHTDLMLSPPNGLYRKLSLSLALTDPEEYEGGDLTISCAGDESNVVNLKPKKGDLVIFYSNLPHKVNSITAGERVTLVTWALGPKVK